LRRTGNSKSNRRSFDCAFDGETVKRFAQDDKFFVVQDDKRRSRAAFVLRSGFMV
jgi:hypothetical protein